MIVALLADRHVATRHLWPKFIERISVNAHGCPVQLNKGVYHSMFTYKPQIRSGDNA